MMQQFKRNRVYIATKLKHGARVRDVLTNIAKQENVIIDITSSWIDIVGKISDDAANAKLFWNRDFADITSSDFLLVYIEDPEEHLRGALVEVGFAIARNIPVILLGDHPDYGTWQHYAGVYKADSIDTAVWMIDHWRKVDG